MNADERNLLAELNAAIDDDGGPSTDSIEAGPMTAATWGMLPGAAAPLASSARAPDLAG